MSDVINTDITPLEAPPLDFVNITVETADQVINHLLKLMDLNEEDHLEHVIHLETLLKSIILSQGGSLVIPKDLFQVIVDGNYKTLIDDSGEAMTLTLVEDVNEEEI